MKGSFPAHAAKMSWVVGLLAYVLYCVSGNVGTQMEGQTGMLASGIGSLCATFVLLGGLALSLIGLLGLGQEESGLTLVNAALGLVVTATPIAFVVVALLT